MAKVVHTAKVYGKNTYDKGAHSEIVYGKSAYGTKVHTVNEIVYDESAYDENVYGESTNHLRRDKFINISFSGYANCYLNYIWKNFYTIEKDSMYVSHRIYFVTIVCQYVP